MIDPANLERYILWVAANGDNRHLTWREICEMEPADQHDFSILSGIYGKAAERWRKQREREDKQKRELKGRRGAGR